MNDIMGPALELFVPRAGLIPNHRREGLHGWSCPAKYLLPRMALVKRIACANGIFDQKKPSLLAKFNVITRDVVCGTVAMSSNTDSESQNAR